jgi:hypothetical protein
MSLDSSVFKITAACATGIEFALKHKGGFIYLPRRKESFLGLSWHGVEGGRRSQMTCYFHQVPIWNMLGAVCTHIHAPAQPILLYIKNSVLWIPSNSLVMQKPIRLNTECQYLSTRSLAPSIYFIINQQFNNFKVVSPSKGCNLFLFLLLGDKCPG